MSKRSQTGNHALLPAFREDAHFEEVLKRPTPTYSLVTWTFGRGSVIWRIWPAVLLHTIFAAAVVTLSMKTNFKLEIPNVMLTVLGVVIGFVIAYRVGSGYDRYWMGRTCWSDLIRSARQMGRLIWFHVPDRLTPKTPEEIASGVIKRDEAELLTVMAEKRLALDLIEGFCVATKHHLRGEVGIYYEDLYHLVKPLHEHEHKAKHKKVPSVHEHPADEDGAVGNGKAKHLEAPSTSTPPPASAASSAFHTPPLPHSPVDPVIPSINAYGTFPEGSHQQGSSSHLSHHSRLANLLHHKVSWTSTTSDDPERQALLKPAQATQNGTMMGQISGDLIPFAGLISSAVRALKVDWAYRTLLGKQQLEVLPPTWTADDATAQGQSTDGGVQRVWRGTVADKKALDHGKHRPRVAGDGDNLPLEILRCLSEWFAVLEDRGTVPGTSMGGIIGLLSSFEDSLSSMERILTTPLPFVYSVHIRHTVWIYLFTLPFQLVVMFGWHTIAGVAVASFIFLGFLAAGDEIEQPFGYEDNDLDLDLFCRAIIHEDLQSLKQIPCLNSYIPPAHQKRARKWKSLVEESRAAPAQKPVIQIQTVHESTNEADVGQAEEEEQAVFGRI